MNIQIITISDRAFRGEYEDVSGPAAAGIFRQAYPEAEISITVVPDEEEYIRKALDAAAGADFIITSGGTGIGPRDLTPEITARWCEKELPGIAEILRTESYRETPQAMLSRGRAGVKGHTVVINFPGSEKAVRLCARIILPLLPHAPEMLRGEGHEEHRKE
ncbi:MAG: MogA/MoaB family molybdenum cofactor biosynthesis protein [Spirochaetales bacterium]|nr:MogA/MoaB family molybdenum cofactor biosynthesis protein [Spirochaetales bacterium]